MFNQDPASGQNKLYNILKAYSILNDRVRYTQGMNFIAAVILLQLDEPEDEFLAFYVFMSILDKDEWRNMFLIETPKLYQVTDQIKEFIQGNTKKLA